MKGFLRAITRIYARLVSLFPPKFRQDFGEEMQVVFSEMLSHAAGQGKWRLAVACAHELIDFPVLLVRAHLEEKHMNAIFRSQPVRFAFRGLVGLSLGLACLRSISMYIVYWLSTSFGGQMGAGWLHVLAVFAGCGTAALAAGLVFALLFGERTHMGWYVLVGTLGWFIPQGSLYVLNMSLYNQLDVEQSSMLSYVVLALMGGFIGMMLCVANSKRRFSLWPLIAAAFLFPILSFFLPKLFILGVYTSRSFYFATILLLALFLAGAVFLTIKIDRRGLWMVLAGAISYPLIVYLYNLLLQLLHIHLAMPGNSLNAVYQIKAGLLILPEGIVLGLLLGLIFGWQSRATRASA